MAFIEIKTYVNIYHWYDLERVLALEAADDLLLEDGDRFELEGEYGWWACQDVLTDPGPVWEYGLPGAGPTDWVADTGILTFTLDNSRANYAHLEGYYTMGHANCPFWFAHGMPVAIVCERQDTMAVTTRFLGEIIATRPSSGMYGEQLVEVEARDWFDFAAQQKIGLLAIETGITGDDAITSMLANFPADKQPNAVDLDVGVETWDRMFSTDDSDRMKMVALFQKICRNEGGGQIFLEGDGTLRFDNRSARPAAATSFNLDPVHDLDAAWDREDIYNRVECKVYPYETDAAATTLIWKLQKTFHMANGDVLVLRCPFSDPTTGKRISAIDVVDPLVGGTHIKYGSVDDGSTNDLIGNLTFPMTVGGNSAEITLTATAAGYVNFIEIRGKGIYTYDPLVQVEEDAASIALYGERPLSIDLEQLSNPGTAHSMAALILENYKDASERVERVRFLANFSDEYATAMLTLEPNVKFGIAEQLTATLLDYYACRIRMEAQGPLVWVEVVPVKAPAINYFIWDSAGHGWDEGRWKF